MDSTTLPALIAQFRQHYPSASLITDLLMLQDGVYVVRAAIHLGDLVTASGLSASTTLEEAEDQAILRALRSLNLIPDASPPQSVTPSPSPTDAAPGLDSHSPDPYPAYSSSPGALDPSDWDRPAPPPRSPQTDTPLFAVPSPEPLPTPALSNVDRSEDIAKIMVEMGRLGWTRSQGRDHLRKTYGKDTRQDLTDEELMDFLRFLEAQ